VRDAQALAVFFNAVLAGCGIMLYVPKRIPEYINVSPIALVCPYCKTKIGEPCMRVADELELVHLQRIEAAAEKDREAKKSRPQ
jgi:hypothetical protein